MLVCWMTNPLQFFLDLIETSGADALAVEEDDIIGVVAEDAGRMIFLKDDAIIIGEDLDGILDLDVHGFADLNGEHDSAQLVDFSDHSGGFHNVWVPFICYGDVSMTCGENWNISP